MRCGKCHRCGGPIRLVLDGEEWRPRCGRYQRPIAHGWSEAGADEYDRLPCPRTVSQPTGEGS